MSKKAKLRPFFWKQALELRLVLTKTKQNYTLIL